MASLEESSQLLNSKIDDQYQTKIESASKYRMRLSGHRAVERVWQPRFRRQPGISQRGRSPRVRICRQWPWAPVCGSPNWARGIRSEVGWGETSGNLQVDFSGGFTDTPGGVNFGLLRMRIASLRMDWTNTSVVAGQDNAFISPLSPTSFASLAVPAFGYAGNLWGWIPQVRVEHRFAVRNGQTITLQGGIMDNITGELPASTFERGAQAGENSGQPAYVARVSWTRTVFGMPLTLGTAGYYSRQNWNLNQHVDGWAGMTDWNIPLSQKVSLSGEFYRGRAIGALGGGVGRSVLFSSDTNGQVQPLNSVGGWSQLKFRATSKLEFNGAFGVDSPYAADVRTYPVSPNYVPSLLLQNRSAMVNFIYRCGPICFSRRISLPKNVRSGCGKPNV